MTINEIRKALNKAKKDPEFDLSGELMVAIEVDGENEWYVVTEVSEGGSSPLFPTLKIKPL